MSNYDIPDTTVVDHKILLTVWNDWIDNISDVTPMEKEYLRDWYFRYLHSASYYNRFVKKFQNWIWEQGGVVILKDGKQYIQFTDPQQATVFLLRWS